MIDVAKLDYVLAKKGKTYETLAATIKRDVSTVRRKIQGKSDFYRREVELIAQELSLEDKERDEIFFYK